jgi:UTP--glucose-1-phosphate uridylyltransferase
MNQSYKKVRKAVFPVAGLGTRFLPATKSIPKEMLTIIDRPLIQYAVEEAKAAGIEEFIFVTGRGKTPLEDFFDYSYELNETLKKRGNSEDLAAVNDVVLDPGAVIYTRQQEPLGLGHAVWCARHLIKDEPFAVLLADDLIMGQKPCLKEMMDAYKKSAQNIVALMDVAPEETENYGVVTPKSVSENLIQIDGFVEKPLPAEAPSSLAIVGRYILSPNIFKSLEAVQSGKNGEIQLTDAMAHLLKKEAFSGVRFAGTRHDCGSKQGLVNAVISSALSREDMSTETSTFIKQLVSKK